MNSIAIIILAAGGSVRFGGPKQLAPLGGRTLIRRAVDAALEASCGPVIVVLGANVSRIEVELDGLPVTRAVNPDWEKGMGTSIGAGMKALPARPLDAVLLMVCDQPCVSPKLLNELVEVSRSTGKGIVAAEYAGIRGVPVLFSSKFFSELSSLSGKEGAKKLLQAHADDLGGVSFPEGELDIDLVEDLTRMNRGINQ